LRYVKGKLLKLVNILNVSPVSSGVSPGSFNLGSSRLDPIVGIDLGPLTAQPSPKFGFIQALEQLFSFVGAQRRQREIDRPSGTGLFTQCRNVRSGPQGTIRRVCTKIERPIINPARTAFDLETKKFQTTFLNVGALLKLFKSQGLQDSV